MDALVLAGGRSARLGSVAKAGLVYQAKTLLERTLDAVAGAATVVVVGPDAPSVARRPVLHAREDPPFGGPVAAIGAGMDALAADGPDRSDFTAVLACDMPHVASALEQLLAALDDRNGSGDADGVIAADAGGRLQPLAAVYRTSALRAALDQLRRSGTLDGLPVFQLISGLRLTHVPVSGDGTRDIDTWHDAEDFGISRPPIEGETMTSPSGNDVQASREQEDEVLRQWCARLVEALAVEGLEVDLKGVLGLAGRAAHSVLRPAAPLTTFVVGYAAGLAVGAGQATSEAAVKSAMDVGFQLCRDEPVADADHGKP